MHKTSALRAVISEPAATARIANLGLTSERARSQMVLRLRSIGVQDPEVLRAMNTVQRHAFVEPGLASNAYQEIALPIGHGQTISRPATVARMLAAACALPLPLPLKSQRVLEIGTGCGYQAAVMSHIFGEVYTIERVRALHEQSRLNLRPFRLANLRLAFGDGCAGLIAAAPFDTIVIAAAGPEIPDALMQQMTVGGRLIAPVGEQEQTLHLVERVAQYDWRLTVLEPARFVPLRSGTA